MRPMKNTILRLMMAAVLCAGMSFAQGGKRGGRLADALDLSAEQKPKVEAILKEQREAMQAARKNNASKEDRKAIQEKTRTKLSEVLNAEQMQKFEKGAKKVKHRRKPDA